MPGSTTLPVMPVPAPGEPLTAWRVDFHAPVASFRDPLFPGLCRGLPVPPPSTVRGLLAAATGEQAEVLPFGMAGWAAGGGVDAETYHPIAADGSNPAVSGRVRAGKGGMTLRERPFLTDVHLTVWLPGRDGERIAAALRRPRWPLRLGRSQDIVHPTSARPVTLVPATESRVGHALAPVDGHAISSACVYHMAASISADRLSTAWADYLWCDEPTGRHPVRGAYREAAPSGLSRGQVPGQRTDNEFGDKEGVEGQAVWLLTP